MGIAQMQSNQLKINALNMMPSVMGIEAFGDNDAMSGAQGDSTTLSFGHNDMSSGYNEWLQANLFRHGDGHLLAKVLNKSLKDNRKLLPDSLRQALMSVARATTASAYR